MNAAERIEDLEGALRDIIVGCDVMLPITTSQAQRRFIEEVKRVASAPLLVPLSPTQNQGTAT